MTCRVPVGVIIVLTCTQQIAYGLHHMSSRRSPILVAIVQHTSSEKDTHKTYLILADTKLRLDVNVLDISFSVCQTHLNPFTEYPCRHNN